jgi:hypothetical protein
MYRHKAGNVCAWRSKSKGVNVTRVRELHHMRRRQTVGTQTARLLKACEKGVNEWTYIAALILSRTSLNASSNALVVSEVLEPPARLI